MGFKRECLLGRSPEKCTTTSARRGDDELVARMVDMPGTDFSKLKRQFRREAPKTITVKRNTDWE